MTASRPSLKGGRSPLLAALVAALCSPILPQADAKFGLLKKGRNLLWWEFNLYVKVTSPTFKKTDETAWTVQRVEKKKLTEQIWRVAKVRDTDGAVMCFGDTSAVGQYEQFENKKAIYPLGSCEEGEVSFEECVCGDKRKHGGPLKICTADEICGQYKNTCTDAKSFQDVPEDTLTKVMDFDDGSYYYGQVTDMSEQSGKPLVKEGLGMEMAIEHKGYEQSRGNLGIPFDRYYGRYHDGKFHGLGSVFFRDEYEKFRNAGSLKTLMFFKGSYYVDDWKNGETSKGEKGIWFHNDHKYPGHWTRAKDGLPEWIPHKDWKPEVLPKPW